ncbi:hypothetical protein ACFVIY_39780 [Streptomyces sp. NPDC127166]|uniref:hypothetical protein n=1 Tax=Streptomyces sp. NPDC127166 TaxID=3345380 RepID=UPI00362909F5
MPRSQSRPAQRVRRAQKDTGGKYTALLREATVAPRRPRKEPAHLEPARRLAARLRLDLGIDAETAARRVDDALAWALKARELSWTLIKTPETDTSSYSQARKAMREHHDGEVTVHDAPLVQAVHLVLEAAADQQGTPELLRAAADVLDRLVGHSHICNAAIYGVRADGCLTPRQTWERVYTTTDPVAALASAAMRTLRDAADIPDEDELTMWLP